MPELPEVETIRNTLKLLVLGETIEHVDVHWPNIVKLPDDINKFNHLLSGQTIQDIRRKGKFLLFIMDDFVMISHLRMEGKYQLHEKGDPLDKHSHVVFHLQSGRELRYNDVRKFGTMHLQPLGEELKHKPLITLGPDPFEEAFTLAYLVNKFKKTTRVIKAVLLDQTVIAGLGNIYVDEVLFQSGVHPLKRANELKEKEIKMIQHYSLLTLEKAIEQGGTTIRSYVNSQGDMGMFQQELFVYGQTNEPCKHCGETIVKLKVAGRGTHICPTCQKE